MAEWSNAQVCNTSVHGFESHWCLIFSLHYTMLSFIPVPIWNKDDITVRALNSLRDLTVFFCEDTRNLQKLFRMYDIDWRNKKLYSLNSFTSDKQIAFYRELLQEKDCWLVSDAWTPGLSDPWKSIIELCRDWSIKFEILPWANALIPWIVASYCDTSKFVFMGFPPTKKGRQTFFKKLMTYDYPVFIYESVWRVEKTLKQLKKLWFTWTVFMSREISKMFEQHSKWTVDEMLEAIKNKDIPLKGEFVLWFLSE